MLPDVLQAAVEEAGSGRWPVRHDERKPAKERFYRGPAPERTRRDCGGRFLSRYARRVNCSWSRTDRTPWRYPFERGSIKSQLPRRVLDRVVNFTVEVA